MKYLINKSLWAGAAMLLLSSCGTVFEDGDLCPPEPVGPSYQVRFDDSRNMNFADAFASEVKSVTLYVLDSQTKDLVKVFSEDNQKNLQSGNYTMKLDLDPGTYDLVAWCGLAETEANKPSFSLTGEAKKIDDLNVKLNEKTLNQHLTELHNGVLMRQSLTANDTTLVVPLTRNINNVRVVLQRIDGTNLNADDFSFSITADNGLMKYDNSLLPGTELVYTEYDKRNDASTIGGVAVVGEVSTARMVKGENMRLRAMYKDRTLLNIPLITYALMVKSHNENVQKMSDQEFLDRQNDWSFIFFLNEQNQWEHSNVVVNDWHLVLDSIEL